MVELLLLTHENGAKSTRICLTWDEVRMDPGLIEHRRNLIKQQREVHKAKMIRFDEQSGQLYQTEAGIASHFYIKVASMELFEEMMNRHMSHRGLARDLASSEFENITPEKMKCQSRGTSKKPSSACPIEIKGDMSDKVAKVNLLCKYTFLGSDWNRFHWLQIRVHFSNEQNMSSFV